MKHSPKLLAAFLACALLAPLTACAQGTNFPPGILSGVAQSVMKVGLDDDLPAKLCDLLWPEAGSKQKKLSVKKISSPGSAESFVFIERTNDHAIILMHFTETKPDSESKTRKEIYFRTTLNGDLTLALKANFQFTLDDLEGEHLKKVTWQTYGQVSGDGTKPLPITPDITKQFEADKKFWLGLEKKLKKMEKQKAKED